MDNGSEMYLTALKKLKRKRWDEIQRIIEKSSNEDLRNVWQSIKNLESTWNMQLDTWTRQVYHESVYNDIGVPKKVSAGDQLEEAFLNKKRLRFEIVSQSVPETGRTPGSLLETEKVLFVFLSDHKSFAGKVHVRDLVARRDKFAARDSKFLFICSWDMEIAQQYAKMMQIKFNEMVCDPYLSFHRKFGLAHDCKKVFGAAALRAEAEFKLKNPVREFGNVEGTPPEVFLSPAKCGDDLSPGDAETVGEEILRLFGAMNSYKAAFETLGVSSLEDFNKIIAMKFDCVETKAAAEQFWDAENRWNDYLNTLDKETGNADAGGVALGVELPQDVRNLILQDADGQQHESFNAKKCTIAIVSFLDAAVANEWKESVKTTLPIILDPHRILYSTFGLSRSFQKVFSHEAMSSYAKEILAGKHAIGNPKEIGYKPDYYMMGGDFLLNAAGKVLGSYPTTHSFDRVKITTILETLP
ncbi:unnamed protein product [Notodromas monacha]|uniref:Uncharacterized protein n=1 Tax=Notodromas monacha TaxID=399045 RepID=A0A7R9GEV8_9CRUS|nr:unnamed protein product [Notodromas monacha]CAG0918250.1 unnamed protein product [Notodromas monacha]